MHTTIASCTRSAVARVLTRRDDKRIGGLGSFSVSLGCLLFFLWSYCTYMDWPTAWPAPIRPILKMIGWIWMAVG
jgi:hypothetical protein